MLDFCSLWMCVLVHLSNLDLTFANVTECLLLADSKSNYWWIYPPYLYRFLWKIEQIYVKVSLELNVIETNWFFLQKEGVNTIELDIKYGPNEIGKCHKGCQFTQRFTKTFKYGSVPPPLSISDEWPDN